MKAPSPPRENPAAPEAGLLVPASQVLQHSMAATALADLDGRITYVNPAFVALWGFAAAAEVVGRSAVADFWARPEEAAVVVRTLLATGSWQGPLDGRRADGATKPLWCAAHLLRDANGRAVALMGTFVDRSAEAAALAALADEKRFVEAVIGSAGVLVVVLDAAGRIVRFNAAAERASGLGADEVLGRFPWDTVLPAEVAATVRREAFDAAIGVMRPGEVRRYTNEWQSPGGGRRLIEWTNSVLEGPEGGARFMVAVGIDVTDRAAADRALRRRDEQLREAQRVAQIGSWELDLVTQRLEWSDEVYTLFEIDPQRFAASYEAFLARVHPEDRPAVDAAYQRSLARREPYSIEHRLCMPDGRIKWVEERGHSDYDDSGRPLRSVGTVQDIHERKRMLATLAQAEAQLRATLDLYPGWVACVDDEMRYVYVNETLCRGLGRPREQIVGRPVAELRGAVADAELRDINRRLLAGEQVQLERRYVNPRGGEGVYWVQYRVSTDANDPRRHVFYAFGTDLTEAHRVQRRLNAVVERTSIGIWEWNHVTEELQLNEQMARLSGHAASEVPPSPRDWLLARIHADDRELRRREMTRMLEGGGDAFECEFRIRHREGHWVWVLERARVVSRTTEGKPLLVIGTDQDITALKRNEIELERLNRELEARVEARTRELAASKAAAERASAAKTDFLSSMSHELRTPLNAILGFGQLLEMASLPAQAHGQAHEIVRAGQHLLDLINEMLDLATVESGRILLASDVVVLAPLVEECIALVRPAAEAAALRLETRVPPSCPRVVADRGRLKQVLLNLLSNAVKYNRAGGRIVVDGEAAAGRCEIRVHDTGAGLDPGQIARLFQPFERLGAVRSAIQGTGIGLSLSKRLIELMGGEIGVTSTPGEGSTFWVRLPLAEAPAAGNPVHEHPGATAAAAADAGAATPTLPVLYIEDNPANQRLMEAIVGCRGDLALSCEADPLRAITRAQQLRPALVLLDIQLPGIDGFEVLTRLQQAGVAAPVVAVSANAMPAEVQRGLAAGFRDYLTKPLEVDHVLAVLRALLPPRR